MFLSRIFPSASSSKGSLALNHPVTSSLYDKEIKLENEIYTTAWQRKFQKPKF